MLKSIQEKLNMHRLAQEQKLLPKWHKIYVDIIENKGVIDI